MEVAPHVAAGDSDDDDEDYVGGDGDDDDVDADDSDDDEEGEEGEGEWGDDDGDGGDGDGGPLWNAHALFAFLLRRAQGDEMPPSVRQVFDYATDGNWDATFAGEGGGAAWRR